jgi:hypothetical protein
MNRVSAGRLPKNRPVRAFVRLMLAHCGPCSISALRHGDLPPLGPQARPVGDGPSSPSPAGRCSRGIPALLLLPLRSIIGGSLRRVSSERLSLQVRPVEELRRLPGGPLNRPAEEPASSAGRHHNYPQQNLVCDTGAATPARPLIGEHRPLRPVGIAHDVAAGHLFNAPRRGQAARCHSIFSSTVCFPVAAARNLDHRGR